MGIIPALSLIIGLMGGIATTVALKMENNYVLIWVIFIAWASFYAAGGKEDGLMKSTAANIWGSVVAAVSLMAFLKLAPKMDAQVAAGICVGIAIVVLIMAAHLPALSAIPSQVFGYAPTAGLFLLGGATYGAGNGGLVKVCMAIIVSMVIGNVLGYISEKAAGAVAKS
jgi:Protein of unknown function (DUF1097)